MKTAVGDPLCVEQFRPDFTVQLYKANIEVTNQHLSGLLLVKKMPDSSTRLLFSTETGFKFFDFSFGGPEDFKAWYVMEKLNKKVVVEALRNDFELLLMRWTRNGTGTVSTMDNNWYHGFRKGGKSSYYLTDSLCTEMRGAELASKRKKLVAAQLFYAGSSVPDSMYIQHYNFNFTISLKKLER